MMVSLSCMAQLRLECRSHQHGDLDQAQQEQRTLGSTALRGVAPTWLSLRPRIAANASDPLVLPDQPASASSSALRKWVSRNSRIAEYPRISFSFLTKP